MLCRICYKKLEKPFLSLGNMPLSNSLVIDPLIPEKYYPLDAYLCPECYMVQTPEFELAKNIFSTFYPYFSSYSESWLKHCKDYVDMMMKKHNYGEDSFIVEIGSNDGYLLQYFKEYNVPILGIEPSESVAITAIKKNIPTEIEYFDKKYAMKMAKNGNYADLIIGNNVLAHNPDLHDFVEGLKYILKSGGIITIEFPHLLNMIQKCEFDNIYAEHFSYLSLYAVIKLFKMHGLIIYDAEEITTHGGSLRIYARHDIGIETEISANIKNILEREKRELTDDSYSNFENSIKIIKEDIIKLLTKLKSENKKIIGYGAAAKAATLLNYCKIGTDLIDYIVDINPAKQGKFMPGSHIPIIDDDNIKEDRPDIVIIFPWNIKDEIMKQLYYVKKEWNGKFIVPIPKPVII